jgi:hypothetical protein
VGSGYTGRVQVSAFKSDGTPLFQNYRYGGWTSPRTISGVTGTVYILVENYSSAEGGTYGIRVYDPSRLPPQSAVTLRVTPTPGPSVVIQWNSVSGATGYRVYRSATETGTYTRLGDDTKAYSYTDTTVSAGGTYWYKAAAYNDNGEGEKSQAISSGAVPTASSAAELTVGAALSNGSLAAGEVKWYRFTAVSGTNYAVQWTSSWTSSNGIPQRPDSSYLLATSVSAFKSDGTPISGFLDINYGWSSPKIISGVTGTVYILVKGNSTSAGTYGIKVYEERL